LKAATGSAGLFSLAGTFLDFIDAELKNQGNLQQPAIEIEFYPEISVITRYWNLQTERRQH
jgi:hypothetical protein